ncbi:superoxide dismutase family protein [Roseospira marina]|uniref:Superoxide dismutase family protein n=2 Tax=Roseospira marina TaxID=140057 RepID=A0A5M6IE52_9PROT|nr:superoxide dismutase family protein [Roseospira marina]
MQGKAEATAELRTPEGQVLGTVSFHETPSGMLWVAAHATDVPPGRHGFHIHETGTCDADTDFKSAGGHLAGGHAHGVLDARGPHPGDLPNVTVHDDGRLDAEFFLQRLSVDEGLWLGDAALFDSDGAAVVLHDGADDYESQPSGAAGPRIACGVIERVGEP